MIKHRSLDALRAVSLGAGLLLTVTVAVDAAPCHPIVTFADGKLPAREIFVSPTGHDGEGDGTRGRPFQSIGRAAREVRPGEAIRLLPGAHESGTYLEGLAGTAEAPIWLGGLPQEAALPVIKGGRQALHLSRARYLILENLKITGTAQNGINIDDGGRYDDPEATRHLVVRRLEFEDIGRGGNQDALKLSGVDDFFVLDCAFARTSAGGSGIDQVGCHDGLIARCEFSDMGGNAIQCKGGSANIEIRANRFHNGGQRAVNAGGSTGFQFFRPPLSRDRPNVEARDIRVLANLFVGGAVPVAFVGCVDGAAVNNTVIRPERWILRILQETTSRDGFEFLPCGQNQFVNNLIYFGADQIGTHVNIGSNTDPDSFLFSNNLWYAFDRPERSRPRLPTSETEGVVGKNPEFVDAAAGDYRLSFSSPAAKAGVSRPEVRGDFEERCYGNPPAIGAFAPALENASKGLQLRLAGDWSIEVTLRTSADTESRVTVLDVPPARVITVAGEPHASLPLFNPRAGGWANGAALRGIQAQECTTRYLLDPESFVLRQGAEPESPALRRDRDYAVDLEWGTFGRLPEGNLGDDATAYAFYRHGLLRLDSIVLRPGGEIVLRRGEGRSAAPRPPELGDGERRLANVWLPGRIERLAAEHLFPITEETYPEPEPPSPRVTELRLPRALAKLREGRPLRLLAWGDSVTVGSYLPDPARDRWQEQFVARLRKRFPEAQIELITEAWGGRNTGSYLNEPPGSEHNYQEKVLDARPDLIISEFVNDAGLNPAQVEERYGKFLADFRSIGAEWIILTPHYVRPDWMGLTRERDIDEDPRPYVQGLREFAARHHVALADASLRYGRLWRQGIPYSTLMLNSINHPDARGLRLFADSLMALF